MSHPYRDRGVAPVPTEPRRPLAKAAADESLAMGYDEDANVGELEDERPGGLPLPFAMLAVAVAAGVVGTLFVVREWPRALVVAPQSDVVARRSGVVIARSNDLGSQIGDRCTIDIADVEEGGRRCGLHVMCAGRELGFIDARCPLDPSQSSEERRWLSLEAFDGDRQFLGRATLELEPPPPPPSP